MTKSHMQTRAVFPASQRWVQGAHTDLEHLRTAEPEGDRSGSRVSSKPLRPDLRQKNNVVLHRLNGSVQMEF